MANYLCISHVLKTFCWGCHKSVDAWECIDIWNSFSRDTFLLLTLSPHEHMKQPRPVRHLLYDYCLLWLAMVLQELRQRPFTLHTAWSFWIGDARDWNLGLLYAKHKATEPRSHLCDEILRDSNAPQGALPAKLPTDRRTFLYFGGHQCSPSQSLPMEPWGWFFSSVISTSIVRQDLPLSGNNDGY